MKKSYSGLFAACLILSTSLAHAFETPPAAAPAAAAVKAPFTVERLALPGPVAGVVVKVDLQDPRVKLQVALADDRDPDGAGPAVGLLDTPTAIARRNDFAVTINASFFAVIAAREVAGKRARYYIGNGGYPVGWHQSDKVQVAPGKETFRSALVVGRNGAARIDRNVEKLGPEVAFAVSGNIMMLEKGAITPPAKDAAKEPRSAVGVSADGRTLILAAIDGRQPGHSIGVTMAELGAIMRDLGAHDGLNLDGGGSTALVLKDPGTGGYAIANKPSDLSSSLPGVVVERPVVDVIGISVKP